MKTQQQQEQQPADAAMSHGTTTSLQQPVLEFTAYEIEMAEVLAGLSKSNTSMGKRGASEASIALGTSSRRLVNAKLPAGELLLPRNPGLTGYGDEEEHGQEVLGSKRKLKHYRSIGEIYCATDRFVRDNLRIKKE